MINPLWPLLSFIFIIPLIVLFWVLLTKRKDQFKESSLKEIINREKQISSLMRYK